MTNDWYFRLVVITVDYLVNDNFIVSPRNPIRCFLSFSTGGTTILCEGRSGVLACRIGLTHPGADHSESRLQMAVKYVSRTST
jgi:hypothetical protein